MATLGEMATGIAHELNQPLSVIKTASSFFIKKINKQEEIAAEILNSMLTKIDENVDRASKIINHMRQFARKSDMEMEKIHVHMILESAFEIFSQQLKVRGIGVQWNLDKKVPKIHGDPGRLEQVFINLLLNARDAIEERWAGVDAASAEKRITLTSGMLFDKVFVRVQDTGSGIPKHLVEKIFEPFFTTKEVGKGTGLGLSISYSIIKECGGDISVTSEENKGTCFTVKFPVAA
jgi:histidine kinase